MACDCGFCEGYEKLKADNPGAELPVKVGKFLEEVGISMQLNGLTEARTHLFRELVKNWSE